MKFRKAKLIILLLLSMFVSINIAQAEAGFSGSGNPATSISGGGGGGTSTGYEFGVSVILKFSLVDFSGGSLNSLYEAYMLSNEGTIDDIFMSNKNVEYGDGSHPCPKCIRGKITSGDYSDGAYIIDELPYKFSNLTEIIPNKEGLWMNFNASELKKAIMASDTEITDEYDQIVIYMMEKAGLISPGLYTKSTDFDNSIKNSLDKYRIIIEPVYYLKQNDNHFVFATTKAIATISKKKGHHGVYAGELRNNLYATENVHNIINNPYRNTGSDWDSIADVKNGDGYALVRLSYNTTSTCNIKKDATGNFIYVDLLGGEYNNDRLGTNFEYFIGDSQCKCDGINNSMYKDELLNNFPLIKSIYDSKCKTTKTCTYEVNSGRYSFYDKSGNILHDYNSFIDECGCSNTEVSSLKGTFSREYKNKCTFTKESYDSNLDDCDDSETYDKKDIDDNYSNYYLNYKKETNLNNYCNETCTENININNLKNKFYTYIGTFFNYNQYPELIAEKKCSVEVKYNDWYNDYYNGSNGYLDKEITAYNNYIFDQAVENPTSNKSITCNCDITGCDSGTEYYYDYKEYYYDSTSNTIKYNNKKKSSYKTGDCGDTKPSKKYVANSIDGTIANLKNHFSDLRKCYTHLNDFGISPKGFYDFSAELNYYYEQEYKKASLGITRNDKRPNNIDDSKFEVSKTDEQDGNYKSSEFISNTHNYPYITGDNTSNIAVDGEKIGSITNNVTIDRNAKYKYKYSHPYHYKYVDVYTAKIKTNSTGNTIALGYVYDTDIGIVAKDGNKHYYSFSKLGDSNKKIFNKYKSSTTNSIERYCTYKTKDKSEFVYRIVDPNNIDPNDRITSGEGLKNWTDLKIEEVESLDTFNPDNLEYSFSINAKNIIEIRESNETSNYSDFIDYNCESEGIKCKSDFVEKYAQKTDGRDNWK